MSALEKLVNRVLVRHHHGGGAGSGDRAPPDPPAAAPAGPEAAAGEGAASSGFRIDFRRLARQGFVTPATLDGRIARDCSMVKRRLLRRLDFFRAKGQGGGAAGEGATRTRSLVLVTSGNPGEGKTFTAVNLALSLAIEEEVRVLLVDADLANPSVPAVFGLDPVRRGLFDRVHDPDLGVADLLLRAEPLPLSVLPAGSRHVSAARILHGGAMSELIGGLARLPEHDIVILDGPPLLATTEAAVLAQQVDEILLIVEAGRSTAQSVEAALELLDDQDKVSLILNRTYFSENAAQYTGYYGRRVGDDPRHR